MHNTINNVRVAGISVTLPEQIESIHDCKFGNTEDRQKFVEITGIENRRIVKPTQCASDLCMASANQLIEGLGWNREDIELLIFVSQTPDYFIPATAIVLQDKLSLSKKCLAFDINLGCSGYVVGLQVIANLLSSLKGKKALLLVGDTSSRSILPVDLNVVAPLFGDAGSATALEWAEDAKPIYIESGSDGSGFKSIISEHGSFRNPLPRELFSLEKDGYMPAEIGVKMDGHAIFNFSTSVVPQSVKSIIKYSGIDITKIDYFIFHQANKLLNECIRKTLKIDPAKHPYSLQKYANTSSATIPVTIVSELSNTLKKDTEYTMLTSGFGIGLSWSSAIFNIKNIYLPELLQI